MKRIVLLIDDGTVVDNSTWSKVVHSTLTRGGKNKVIFFLGFYLT